MKTIILSCALILSRSLFASSSHEAVFTQIYETNQWGSNEEGMTPSGPGSNIKYAYPFIELLQNFIISHNIQTVVDVGCGDWSLFKHVNWDGVHYTGIDIVKEMVKTNDETFSSPTIQFVHGDILNDTLPKADLLICKDVLQHLSNEDIHRFLKQLSQFKHCLIVNDTDSTTLSADNCDISPGRWRKVDLTQPPFSIPGEKLLTYESFPSKKQVLHIGEKSVEKTVLIAILARNKGHTLPEYLQCVENLDFNKKHIGLYINTNNNTDDTLEVLLEWVKCHQKDYRFIVFEAQEVNAPLPRDPHDWTPQRFALLGDIRNRSLKKAMEYKMDYYFVIDCDNFVTPCTLKELILKDQPIIAPMLRSIPEKSDCYSNYWCDVNSSGHYLKHPDYFKILNRSQVGTFKVPVVHCTYLVKTEYIDKLNYLDETEDFEFIIFSRNARENEVDQYICNEKDFGFLVHFHTSPTLDEEKRRVREFFHNLNEEKRRVRELLQKNCSNP